MNRLLIKGTIRLLKNVKTIRWSSSSSKLIEKYGQHVQVSVPLIREAIDYPEPVLHKDYAEVRRMTNEWASQFWENQSLVDYLLASDWPYTTGYHVPHFEADHYLGIAKFAVWLITLDYKIDNDYDSDQRKNAYKNLSKLLMQFLLNFQNKTNGNAFETYANELISSSNDGAQRMSADLMKLIGREKLAWPLIKRCLDWFMGYLKNDLRQKKDETNFAISFQDYINHRRATFGSEIMFRTLMYAESNNIEENDRLMKVAEFKRFFNLFELIVALPNDIRSFELEQSRNDHWGNGVTVLAREKGVSLQEGVEMLIQMLDDAITEFQTIGWRLVQSDNLNQRFCHLQRLVEVAIPNFAYGAIKTCDINGCYKVTGGGLAKTFDPNPNVGDRIDPKLIYSRVKK